MANISDVVLFYGVFVREFTRVSPSIFPNGLYKGDRNPDAGTMRRNAANVSVRRITDKFEVISAGDGRNGGVG